MELLCSTDTYTDALYDMYTGTSAPSGHPLSLLYGAGSDTSTANQLTVRDAASKGLFDAILIIEIHGNSMSQPMH